MLQDARIYCQEIRDTIKILKSNRDMAFNEIKLTVAIEDPRARERRENLASRWGTSSHLHARMQMCIAVGDFWGTSTLESGHVGSKACSCV